MEHNRIRIIKTPAGEAPLWVREAWVGVEIPIVQPEHALAGTQMGVLGGRASEENQHGYEVRGADAIIALRNAGKERAACWWEGNTSVSRANLVFGRAFCERL